MSEADNRERGSQNEDIFHDALVLIVDDHDIGRYTKSRIMLTTGCRILEASTGLDAVRLASLHRPGLIILDVRLPDISGIEVCHRLKSTPELDHTMILFVSATAILPSDRVRGLVGGGDGYMVEPVDPDELRATAAAFLRLSRAERRLRESEHRVAAELSAMKRLHELVARLSIISDFKGALKDILHATVEITGADKGHVQLFDREKNLLEIAAYTGFDDTFLKSFQAITLDHPASCARALVEGRRVVFEDVQGDVHTNELIRAPALLGGYRAVQSTPLLSRTGEPLGVLSTHYEMPHRPTEQELRVLDLYTRQAADVLERVRSAETLKESESRFRLLADATPVILWVTTATGGLQFVNEAYRLFFGMAEQQVRDDNWKFLLHPDDRDDYVSEYAHCLREHRPFYARSRVLHANGHWRWIVSHATPRISSVGEFQGYVGCSLDIHELIMAQHSLEDKEERLRLAMTAGNMGAWDIDLKTDAVTWDAKQHEIFGSPSDRPPATMQDFYRMVHPDDLDELKAVATAALLTGRLSHEFRIVRPDGLLRWIASVGATVPDRDGQPMRMVGVNYDITSRKEAEEKIARFAEELEREVCHRTEQLLFSQEQLRRLTTELNLAEQRERKRLATELHDHLQQTLVLGKLKVGQNKQAWQDRPEGAALIADLDSILTEALTYTRTLVAELSPPALAQHGLIAGLRWLAEYMKKHELTVTVNAPDATPRWLPENQAVIVFQSVRELLINAAKYAGTGQAYVDVETTVEELRIVVRDFGRGFDWSRREERTDLGSSFGLISIQERMKSLGGSFVLSSSPGAGTTAILTMPFQGARTAQLPSAPELQHRTGLPQHDMPAVASATSLIRVLLVDDHIMLRQGLRTILETHSDIEVVGEAGDGASAVALVDELNPAVVVMDISMPTMDGIEATNIITGRHPQTAVIGLSVNASGEHRKAMEAAGAFMLLTKEAAADELYTVIRDLYKPMTECV